MEPADLLIHNGRVLTLDDEDTEFPDGAVAVRGDRILSVGPKTAIEPESVKKAIDARGGLIMPGLINTHTHAAMTLFRGIADDLPLMTWLDEHIFPAETHLDADKVFLGTLLACTEMIRTGTTCFCDMYLFEDAVARAASKAGVRAVVGEVLYDFPSPNYGPLEQGYDYTRRLAEKWREDPLVKIAVEPHSPYLCSPELLQRAVGIARELGLLQVIHVSETRAEVRESLEKYGLTPVERLADLGILGPDLLACHCVAVNEKDIELLAESDTRVSHNPESNMKLASGIAPVKAMLKKGVCVGLGTDGCASNNNLDLFSEMDTAAKLQKVSTLDPTVADARSVLRMATVEGAKALGLEDRIGSVEAGKLADLIVVDTHRPHLTPMYRADSHLVYAARGSDVRTTVINGQVVMEDGRIEHLDVEAIMSQAREVSEAIRKALYPKN